MKSFYATALAMCISSTYAIKVNASTQKQPDDLFIAAKLAETQSIDQDEAYDFAQRKTLVKAQTDAQTDYRQWNVPSKDDRASFMPGGLAQTESISEDDEYEFAQYDWPDDSAIFMPDGRSD